MADLFAEEAPAPVIAPVAAPKDLFTETQITPPSVTEQNTQALSNSVDLTNNNPDIQPIKQAVDEHSSQIEQLAKARFSQETIDNWKQNPITFTQAHKYLDIADVLPLGGIKQGIDAMGIKNIADKVQAGQEINQSEQKTLDDFIDKNIEMNTRGFTFGGGINYYGSQLPAFMGEFALTGGAGKAAEVAAVKAITKGAEVAAVKGIASKSAGLVANIAARTAAMPGMYIPKYAEKRINDSMSITDKGAVIFKQSEDSPAISALKAYGFTSAEVAGELSGAAIGKYAIDPLKHIMKTPLTQAVNQLPVKLRQGLFEAYQKIQPNANISKIFSASGWNGMLEELGEERVTDVLHQAVNLTLEKNYTMDDVLKGITPSKDQLMLEAGLISIAGGVKTSANIGMNILKSKGMPAIEASNAIDNMSANEQDALVNNTLKITPPVNNPAALSDNVIESQVALKQSVTPPAIDHTESTFNKAYRDWYDSIAPIEQVTNKATELGAEIPVGENPNILARTYSGVIGMARQNLQNETYTINKDGNIEITGRGLKPILEDYDNSIMRIEPNRKAREVDLREYLVARRTLEDLSKLENVEVSEKDIATSTQTMAELAQKYGQEFSWFDTHAKELYKYQQRILHNFVDSGNMTQEQYDEILTNHPNYIPFQRVMDEAGFKDAVTSKGVFSNASASSVVKKIRGSERDVKDPINSIIANTVKTIQVAQRNRVATSVVKLADLLPEYIQKVSTPMQKITVDGKDVFRPSGIEPKGAISVFEDGKKQYYQMSKPLLEAMNQLQPTQLSFLEKLFSIPASVLRVGATIVPEFWVRNVLRDQTEALINSKVRPTPIDMVQGLTSMLGNGNLYNEWMKSGGSFNSYMELSDTGLERAYKELFKPDGKVNRYLHNPLALPEDISGALEQGTRIGVFSKAKKSGMSDLEAAMEARQATLDFARGGTRAKIVNRIIPFFNAGMQGTDKLVRTFKENPRATMMWGAATITMPSVLLTGYYLYGAPDEDRKEFLEIPQWQRDMFWVFKKGDTWVRYPKPFSLGYIYGSIPERFMQWMYAGDKPEGEAMWKDVAMGLGGAFSPVYDPSALLPPLVKVAVESATNYNFFTGRNIYPAWMEDLEPEQRKNKYTSETAVAVGEKLGISPAKIDNALRGTIAGSAQYVTGAGDFILNQVKKWNGEEVSEKPSSLSDTPVIRAFVVRDPAGSAAQSTTNFYKSLKESQQVHATFEKLEGNEKDVYLQKNANLIQANPAMNNFSKQIKELNKQRDRIYEDVSVSGHDKAPMVKELDNQIVEIAREANKYFTDSVLNK